MYRVLDTSLMGISMPVYFNYNTNLFAYKVDDTYIISHDLYAVDDDWIFAGIFNDKPYYQNKANKTYRFCWYKADIDRYVMSIRVNSACKSFTINNPEFDHPIYLGSAFYTNTEPSVFVGTYQPSGYLRQTITSSIIVKKNADIWTKDTNFVGIYTHVNDSTKLQAFGNKVFIVDGVYLVANGVDDYNHMYYASDNKKLWLFFEDSKWWLGEWYGDKKESSTIEPSYTSPNTTFSGGSIVKYVRHDISTLTESQLVGQVGVLV